jgi:uncharacterized heparinase superfamily protein
MPQLLDGRNVSEIAVLDRVHERTLAIVDHDGQIAGSPRLHRRLLDLTVNFCEVSVEALIPHHLHDFLRSHLASRQRVVIQNISDQAPLISK